MKLDHNKIFLFIFLGVIVITMALFSFEKYPKDKIAFGVKIANISIGNKSKLDSEKIIKKEIDIFNKKGVLFIFENNNQKYGRTITIESLKTEYDLEKSINEAFAIGKNKGFFRNLKEKTEAFFGKYNLSLYSKISEDKLDEFLTKNFGRFETSPKNAEVKFEEKSLSFIVVEPKEGLLFSRKKIKNTIENNIQKLKTEDICLSLEKNNQNCFVLEKERPLIETKDAEDVKKEAEEILKSGPYLLFANDKSFVIKDLTLGSWFTFLPQKENGKGTIKIVLNADLIKNYLNNLSKNINTNPQNPVLAFENGLKVLSPPKTGQKLKMDENIQKIQEGIFAKKNKIILSLEKKEPEITEQKINNLKIEKLIGRGASNFGGSPKNRIHNIKVGAAKFNGVLIAPGEIFSFNKTLGNVGPAQGYLPELVIKENRTVPEYGGGICQVSTTMFRAAVNSGMEIIERHPHAYPVRYYNPQGFDATVYLPKPDLVFKNNTPEYILIQSKIEGNNLSFEFYGKDDKRRVVVKGPYQYDFGNDGSMKARLETEVWIGENLVYQKTFISHYKSPKLFPVERRNPLE